MAHEDLVSVVVDEGIVRLPAIDLPALDLTRLQPVRRFGAYRGQRRNPGSFWAATNQGFVPYESRLEAQHLLAADFDSRVRWIVAQPFRLHFMHAATWKSHVPDFLLVMDNGAHEVVNVVGRPERVREPEIAMRLDRLASACGRLGWRTRVALGAIPQPLSMNLRFLAACRVAPYRTKELTPALLDACQTPARWGEVEAAAGDLTPLVRPVIAHLLWERRLHTDLGVRITVDSVLEVR